MTAQTQSRAVHGAGCPIDEGSRSLASLGFPHSGCKEKPPASSRQPLRLPPARLADIVAACCVLDSIYVCVTEIQPRHEAIPGSTSATKGALGHLPASETVFKSSPRTEPNPRFSLGAHDMFAGQGNTHKSKFFVITTCTN